MDAPEDLHSIVPYLRNRILTAFPDIVITASELITTGWDSYIFLINNKFAFKFPRSEIQAGNLEREINLLKEIHECPLAVPDYRYVSGSGSELFGGYTFIRGDPLNSVKSLTDTMILQLTGFLNYLHNVSPSLVGDGKIQATDCNIWRDRYRQLYRTIKDHYSDILTRDVLNLLETEFRNYLTHFSSDFSTSLTHGDLYSGNVIINSKDGKVKGVIDWGDCSIGDPAMDFAALAVDFAGEQILEVLAGYEGPVDDSFRDRIEFYWKMEPFYSISHYSKLEDEIELRKSIEKLEERLSSRLF